MDCDPNNTACSGNGSAKRVSTVNHCDALPDEFVAVTVTYAYPRATPRNDTTEPATDTPTADSLLDTAAYESTTPANAPETSTSNASPTFTT